MDADIVVTHADMRSLGYCNRGAREWSARHGLDWEHFLQHGLPASLLLATGDSMAAEVVAAARKRLETNDGLS